MAECIEKDLVLDNFPLTEYQKHSELFAQDLYEEISLEMCVNKRNSLGGASAKSVLAQVEWVKKELEK